MESGGSATRSSGLNQREGSSKTLRNRLLEVPPYRRLPHGRLALGAVAPQEDQPFDLDPMRGTRSLSLLDHAPRLTWLTGRAEPARGTTLGNAQSAAWKAVAAATR